MIPFYDFNVIFGFIIFAQQTESFNVFVLDRQGHVVELQKPIHIDAENTPKDMRERLQNQLDDFLLKSIKDYQTKIKKKQIRSNFDSTISRNKKYSPVVYSNGRYILDFDKINVKKVNEVPKIPEKDVDFDPFDSFRDYYDYIRDKKRLRSPHRTKFSSKNKSSYRKHNMLLLGGGIFRSGTKQSTEDIEKKIEKKKDAKRSFNRFKVIGNEKKKHKSSSHKTPKKMKKIQYTSEESSASKKDSFEELSAEKPKKRKKKHFSEESAESGDDFLYLQGNELVKVQPKGADDSGSEGNDGRRRLPHFMPKRFHWSPKEIKHLGYFWFNGPKGKYPEATPLR